MAELNHPYVVLLPMGEWTAAYLHVKQGSGPRARRNPLDTVRVPVRLTRDSLPDVLRAVAAELEAPHSHRWQPQTGGPGVPQRGTTGGEPSRLT